MQRAAGTAGLGAAPAAVGAKPGHRRHPCSANGRRGAPRTAGSSTTLAPSGRLADDGRGALGAAARAPGQPGADHKRQRKQAAGHRRHARPLAGGPEMPAPGAQHAGPHVVHQQVQRRGQRLVAARHLPDPPAGHRMRREKPERKEDDAGDQHGQRVRQRQQQAGQRQTRGRGQHRAPAMAVGKPAEERRRENSHQIHDEDEADEA
ncbi:hypothetical protein G6F22_016933 [Rhizopus arrhizus]|nr:hypothetical protein G6F22_016933 [Rhizopus arrhizus]